EFNAMAACETHVVHVDSQHDETPRDFHGIGVAAGVSNSIERQLKMRVAQVLAGDEVSTSVLAGWHRADAHLLEIMRARGADLLIVGSRPNNHVHYGSAPRALLHHSEVSVAVARATAPSTQEKQLPKFNRVLIATDSNAPSADAAVRYGCALVNRGGQLKILQLPRGGNGNGVVLRPKTIREVRSLLPKKLAEEYDIQLDVCTGEESVRGIAHEAEQFRADLICVDAPKTNGDGNRDVLERLVEMTRRPVLVLPVQE
ncbi:MAG: universal stress protein, partial [Burkholderiales bacterium]